MENVYYLVCFKLHVKAILNNSLYTFFCFNSKPKLFSLFGFNHNFHWVIHKIYRKCELKGDSALTRNDFYWACGLNIHQRPHWTACALSLWARLLVSDNLIRHAYWILLNKKTVYFVHDHGRIMLHQTYMYM